MLSPVILKRDTSGSLRTWQYELDQANAQWRVITGGVDSHGTPNRKSVTTGWTVCKGKQGRTDQQQATFEADASMNQKLDREYRATEAELASVPPSPMLAHKYEDHADKLDFTHGVFAQPKLDGIRAIISRHGAFSREYQRHLNVDHILEALAPVFAGDPDLYLDGELYNHELRADFGKIASVVRKQNPTSAQRDEARALIQYHVYDQLSGRHPNSDFGCRLNDMDQYVKPCLAKWSPGQDCIRPVLTFKVTGPEDLDQLYGSFLEAGYEGQMVRTNHPYEPDKRSKSLLKRKEFLCREFKLLRIEEGNGNWAGLAKRVVFQLDDGRECGAGIRGTQDEAALLLKRPRTPTDQVTVRYFTPSPDGVPRFPVVTDFHFGGRKD